MNKIPVLGQALPILYPMLRLATAYGLTALILLGSCQDQPDKPKSPESKITAFQPRSFSLAQIDSSRGFLDSLRALPRADSSLIRQFLAIADSQFIPNEVTDTVTTYHRYTSLLIEGRQAEVIAEITEFNTVMASLHLMLFDDNGKCLVAVPLAYHYDEAGGKENWSSTQNTPTSFLQRREWSDFVYPSREQEIMNPEGRGTTLVHLGIELKNSKVETKRIDSTYTVVKY